MKVRYFHLDLDDSLHKVAQRRIESAWLERQPWDDSTGTKLLRLLSFICDDSFRPLRGFLMRVSVQDGRITEESRHEAIAAMQSTMVIPWSCAPEPTEFPLIERQLEGWPEPDGLFRELAVALDVPLGQIPRLNFGGPLLTALKLGIGVRQALTYFTIEPSE